MIRRNVTEHGQPAWLLISQVEHARLSGELAEHWICNPSEAESSLLPLISRDELLPAIYHHDDGWQAWEELPQVDPQTGRPLSFTEMPLAVALDIWRSSIRTASAIGPLAAWVVASHFTALLSHSDDANEPLAIAWLSEYDALRNQWLKAWEAINLAVHSRELAEIALRQLQLFDFLSLWLCMAERTDAKSFETPGGSHLTLTTQAGSEIIVIHPWPLTIGELVLSVPSRIVPARAYLSSEALAAVTYETRVVTWRFVPNSIK